MKVSSLHPGFHQHLQHSALWWPGLLLQPQRWQSPSCCPWGSITGFWPRSHFPWPTPSCVWPQCRPMTVGQGTPLMRDFDLKILSTQFFLFPLSQSSEQQRSFLSPLLLPSLYLSHAFLIKFYLGVTFKLTQSLKSMRNWISFKNVLHPISWKELKKMETK